MLISYVRKESGQKRGVIVSTRKGWVGFSLCCPKDKFDKDRGKEIAIGRCEKYGDCKNWMVSLLLDGDDNFDAPELLISFPDYYDGNYPVGYNKPAFQLNRNIDVFHILPSDLLFKVISMYERSLRYYK